MKSSMMKKTPLVLCLNIILFGSMNIEARTYNKDKKDYSQLVSNDASIRLQQNQMVERINNLQKYTEEQNKNYDQAIEGIIQQNDKLIDLNQNMLAEIERLNGDMNLTQEESTENRELLNSLTQATTTKVKEIQAQINNQEQKFSSLTGESKLLLIGLLLFSLLLSALLLAMLRKQNKRTVKLKTEVERVLNQIQTNTDTSMANWTEQQVDTMNEWRQDFQSQMEEIIKQSIHNNTQVYISEIKEAANATIAAEKATIQRMSAEKVGNQEDKLNLSQLSFSVTHDTPTTDIHNDSMNLDSYPTDSTLNQLDDFMSHDLNEKDSQQINTGNNTQIEQNTSLAQESVVQSNPNNPVDKKLVNITEISPKESKSEDDIHTDSASDDIFAALDMQTSRLGEQADARALDEMLENNNHQGLLDAVEDDTDTLNLEDINDALSESDVDLVSIDDVQTDTLINLETVYGDEDRTRRQDALTVFDAPLNNHNALALNLKPSHSEADGSSQKPILANTEDVYKTVKLEVDQGAEKNIEDLTKTLDALTMIDDKKTVVINEPTQPTSIKLSATNMQDDFIPAAEHHVAKQIDESVKVVDENADNAPRVFESDVVEEQAVETQVNENQVFETQTTTTLSKEQPVTAQVENVLKERVDAVVLLDADELVQDTVVTESQSLSDQLLEEQLVKKVAFSSDLDNFDVQSLENKRFKDVVFSSSLDEPVNIEKNTKASEVLQQVAAKENVDTPEKVIKDYQSFIRDYEFDNDQDTIQLVGVALDKQAKLLLSNDRVKEAITAYDRIISRYDKTHDNNAQDMVSHALLNSSLLELVHTGSINGSKIGTARTVFRDSPENMLVIETLEALRISARRDVSNTQKDLLNRYEDIDLIGLDWQSLESWANGLSEKSQPRVFETIKFFKGWNGQQEPSRYS